MARVIPTHVPRARPALRVLVVNAGSSSLKLRVVDGDDAVQASTDLPAVDELPREQLAEAVDGMGEFDAIGHRIVHGGGRYAEPVMIDGEVRQHLGSFSDLAPLHQSKSLTALDAISSISPDVPTVACFDTAFHATLPPAAVTYAVPAAWRDSYGFRRYGFHGLSHAYVSERARALLAGSPRYGFAAQEGRVGRRVVTCHLGAGASLAAVLDGRSVDTTMGFTPLEGLVMATRSGTVDPGGLLWLLTHKGLDPADVARTLEHESGLLGLTGTADMAAVIAAAEAGEAAARLAFEIYVRRLAAGVAAMTAALGGLDALVFTGGVGENAPAVRAAAADALGFLGVAVDPATNAAPVLDADVSAAGAPARVLVIESREDLKVAHGVAMVLAPAPARPL